MDPQFFRFFIHFLVNFWIHFFFKILSNILFHVFFLSLSLCVFKWKNTQDLTSTWKKWNVVQSGPGGRISGSVCGQDPKWVFELLFICEEKQISKYFSVQFLYRTSVSGAVWMAGRHHQMAKMPQKTARFRGIRVGIKVECQSRVKDDRTGWSHGLWSHRTSVLHW